MIQKLPKLRCPYVYTLPALAAAACASLAASMAAWTSGSTSQNDFRSDVVVVAKWIQGWSLGLDFCWEKTFFWKNQHVTSATVWSCQPGVSKLHICPKDWCEGQLPPHLIFNFSVFLSKSEMFWLPKLPTSTSGDFPKSCSSSYKTCVFFLKRRGCALLSSAVVAGVGLHLWRFPSHVAFAALDLGLGTCRETWTMGCICNGKEVTKKKSKRTCHDYHFFPWMGERVNFFETKVEMNSTSKDWSHDWKYIENASIPGPATRSPISIQFHGC